MSKDVMYLQKNVGGNQGEKINILIWGNWGMPKTLKDNKDIKQCEGHVGEHLTTLGKCQRWRVTLRKHHRTQDLFFQSTRNCRKNDKDVKQHCGNTQRHQATLGKHWGTPGDVPKMPRDFRKRGVFCFFSQATRDIKKTSNDNNSAKQM